MFARLHPNLGIGLANYFSRKSRASTGTTDSKFYGEDKEMLIQFCKTTLEKEHFDYFIFGHRHLDIQFDLKNNSTYYNLGEWINDSKYGVFDGETFELKTFEG